MNWERTEAGLATATAAERTAMIMESLMLTDFLACDGRGDRRSVRGLSRSL